MSADKRLQLTSYYATSSKASATVHDLGVKLKENRRQRRVRDLRLENARLARLVSEIQTEIVRLRSVLAEE